MSHLLIHNPATGQRIAELPADDAVSVAAKAARARTAQAGWAAVAESSIGSAGNGSAAV